MANIGFGLEVNKYAKQTGFDQFSTSMTETLLEVGKDAWKYNPVSSGIRLYELETNRTKIDNEPLIPFQELNEKYKGSGLFFNENEKQSTVDILFERKKEERARGSIIQRGPKGFLPGTAKFAVGMIASMADPINLAMMFIPVVGQATFLSLVGKYGLTKARFGRGTVEGLVGIAAVEPLVYAAAKREQSDYGLVDSFMAVTFGTLLGGGLHVGAGKLKDMNTLRKFNKRIRKARKDLGADAGEDPAFNIYKEYYPENSRIMKELAETDIETRRLLLARAMSDIAEEIPVSSADVANLNPRLRNAQIEEKVIEAARLKVNEESIKIYKEKIEIQNKINMLEKYYDPKRKISNIKYNPELKKLKKRRSKLQKREKELTEQLINRDKLIDERVTNKKQEITTQNSGARLKNTPKSKIVEAYEKDKAQSSPELKNLDEELTFAENDLLAKTISQESKKLNFKTSEQVEISVKGLENINIKSKEYQSAILEGINCKSGK